MPLCSGHPLCPAGHLPLKGEIRWRTHPFHGQGVRRLSISPLEGEMSGRTEGVSPEQDG
ncbi:lytic murein transglycosylase [Agrobacterium tumefaciens]|nr:lytic murein transglycosylase [Agrobacterium tumefaciens]